MKASWWCLCIQIAGIVIAGVGCGGSGFSASHISRINWEPGINELENYDIEDPVVLDWGSEKGHWHPIDWEASGDAKVATSGYGGGNSLMISNVVPASETGHANMFYRGFVAWYYYKQYNSDKTKRYLKLEQNTDYLFSAFVKSSNTVQPGQIYIKVRMFWDPVNDETDVLRSVDVYNELAPTKGKWKKLNRLVSTDGIDSDEIYAELTVGCRPMEGSAQFDKIQFFKATPEQISQYRLKTPNVPEALAAGDVKLMLAADGRWRVDTDEMGHWWYVSPDGIAQWMRGIRVPQYDISQQPLQVSWVLANYADMAAYRSDRVFPVLANWEFNMIDCQPDYGGRPVIPGSGQEKFAFNMTMSLNQAAKLLGDETRWTKDMLHNADGLPMNSPAIYYGDSAVPDPYLAEVADDMESWSRMVMQAAATSYGDIAFASVSRSAFPIILEYWCWEDPDESAGRQGVEDALVNFIAERYGTVADLNDAWGNVQYTNFADITSNKPVPYTYDTMHGDMRSFARELVKTYLDLVVSTARRNGRSVTLCSSESPSFMWSNLFVESNADLYSRFDVIYSDGITDGAYNSLGLPETSIQILRELHQWTGRPIIGGRLNFMARDTGFAGKNGLAAFDTQEQRATALRNSVYQLATLPFTVGYRWGQWADDYSTDDHYFRNTGMVRSFPDDPGGMDQPYVKLTTMAAKVNGQIARMDPSIRVDTDFKDVQHQSACLCSSGTGGAVFLLAGWMCLAVLRRRAFYSNSLR